MNTPTIQTQRLLRPVARADAPDIFAYASNPNVSRYMPWSPHRKIEESEAFIEMLLARGPDEHAWAIRRVVNPTVIGVIEFGLNDDAEAQLDYVLAQEFWNRGLMTEAARAVLAWGLEHYPRVCRVVSSAMTENVGSQRVMEKCGLRFERAPLDKWEKFAEPAEQRVYVMIRGAVGADDRGRNPVAQ